jgi:hypothetical protein
MVDRVNYKALVDITDRYKYIGEARPGVATSRAKWRILRIDLQTNECLWAESGEHQVTWDDRVGHAYA